MKTDSVETKMKKEVIILIAEDDDGHALLIQKNLKRANISNEILHFKDGEEILNYVFNENGDIILDIKYSYLFLLDIRMPRLDGIEVLKKIKGNKILQKMPVIMITTTDDPREISLCHEYGCNNYITKPINYDKFSATIQHLGLFLQITEIPGFIITDASK